MRIVRYEDNGQIYHGLYRHDQISPLKGDLFGHYQVADHPIALSAVQLLAPIIPRQLFAIGLNYRAHVGELSFTTPKLPTEPISFLVANSAIIGHKATIHLNDSTSRIDQEAELAVVIGKPCSQVTEQDALSYVLGYTCGNDVSNRDLQSQDGQWLRGKSFPTYKPLGPWIETALDPRHLRIQGRVNGQIVQEATTDQLLFGVPELIAFLSSFTTLMPGDVIMTGTPQGVTQLHAGDTVDVTIEGIGTLHNPVD